MRFCPYSAYHILFKKQERSVGKRKGKNEGGETDGEGKKEKNQIEREKKEKKVRNMTDLHKKGVYK